MEPNVDVLQDSGSTAKPALIKVLTKDTEARERLATLETVVDGLLDQSLLDVQADLKLIELSDRAHRKAVEAKELATEALELIKTVADCGLITTKQLREFNARLGAVEKGQGRQRDCGKENGRG